MIQYLKGPIQRPLCLALAFLLVAAALASPAIALAYSCGAGPYDPSCYGRNQWSNSSIEGDNVTIAIVSLGTPESRLQNETWVIQRTGTGACLVHFDECWFEGGYTYTAFSGTEHYFTAWMSPEQTLGYIETPGPVVGTSEYGSDMRVEIRQVSPTGGFYVTILPPVQSGYTNYDTASMLSSDQIVVGMELHGTSGGSAPTADFTILKYITYTGGAYGSQYFTTNGSTFSNGPVAGSWYVTPDTSSTGGDFRTSCTC